MHKHKNPCPGGHETYNFMDPSLDMITIPSVCLICAWGHDIYNFRRPFLGHQYYILSLSDLCLSSREKDFLRNTSILQVKTVPAVLKKKMLTN